MAISKSIKNNELFKSVLSIFYGKLKGFNYRA